MTVTMVLAAIGGLAVGWAIERAVRRLPWGKSLLWPGATYCEECWQPFSWWQSLPAVGFVATLARCPTCKRGRPWDSLWIPLASAALTAVLVDLDYERALLHGVSYPALLAAHLTLVYLLLAASAIDLNWMVIPDAVTVPGMLVGVMLQATTNLRNLRPHQLLNLDWDSPWHQESQSTTLLHVAYDYWPGLMEGLLGLLIGGGVIWMVRLLGSWIFRREAMGFGDVTLMAMVGSLIGWQGAVMAFLLSPLSAIVVGGLGWLTTGKSEIPYGPHLALASVAWVLFLPTMTRWALPLYSLPPHWLVGMGAAAACAFAVVALGIRLMRRLTQRLIEL